MQLIGHGMTSSFLDQVSSIGRDFFALPVKEKLKCLRTAENTQGYGHDTKFSENQVLDWTDRLYLITSPKDQIKFQSWPECPESFRYYELSYKRNYSKHCIFQAINQINQNSYST